MLSVGLYFLAYLTVKKSSGDWATSCLFPVNKYSMSICSTRAKLEIFLRNDSGVFCDKIVHMKIFFAW